MIAAVWPVFRLGSLVVVGLKRPQLHTAYMTGPGMSMIEVHII